MSKMLYRLGVSLLAISLSFMMWSPRQGNVVRVPENEREDHAWEMFQWWYMQRAMPYEMIPQGAFEKAALYAKTKIQKEIPSPSSSTGTPDQWVSIGPNNVGGRTLSLAIDPTASSVIWAGAASGGLWRSTSGGEGAAAWSYVPTGFPSLAISTIAIDPTQNSVMYIGTGEISGYHRPQVGTPGARSSYGMGILKSTNGGSTWSQTSLTWTFSQITAVEKIAINPLNSKTLYAATSEGVYKSTNAGASWSVSDTTLMAMDIAINPSDTGMIYATHGNLNSSPNPGLYQSLDAGGLWLPLTNGLPSSNFGRAVISISPSHPATVYLGVANASNGQAYGLYRSDDNGGSWTQESNVNFTSAQGWYDIAVAVKPNDHLTVFCSGLDVYRSTTGGTSLTQETFWFQGSFGLVPPGGPEGPSSYTHADHHAIVFDNAHPDTVYFCSDGGVFKSTDGGDTYFGVNGGYVTTQFYNGFANAYADSSIALGGLQDNGVVEYEGSPTWDKVDGGDGGWCAIDPTDPKVLYDEYVYLSLKKSVNGGGFSPINAGLPSDAGSANFIAPFAISPSNHNILYAGNKNVWKTTTGGDSWFAPNGGANLNGTKMACIGISHTSSDTLMAGTGSGSSAESPLFQIFASTNGGASWTLVSAPLPVRYPTDIEFDPTNGATVYLTYSGYGTGHVFTSTNVGQTWTDISSNLPNIPHQSVTVDPVQPNNIYVGTDLGVYHSSNRGGTWEDFSAGMVPAMVLDVTISRANGNIRAATFGNGVYQRRLSRLATLAVVAPNGGEVWPSGQVAVIRWSELLVNLVKIEYSTNDGASWSLVADSVPAAPGQYLWNVPSAQTAQARVRISESGTGTPIDESDAAFTILQNADVVDGWNLVSLKVAPPDPRKVVLFPNAKSSAFWYLAGSGYIVSDSLRVGRGYWMKFSGPQLTPYSGDSIAADSVTVRAGWNLIGSISGAVSVSGITQLPPGIVISPYFGYSGGYFVAATLQPGKGYWVKVSADGKLVLHSGPEATPLTADPGERLRESTILTLADAAGRNQTLYLSASPAHSGEPEFIMPPPAPEGGFDARFSTGRMVETAPQGTSGEIPILVSSDAYPVSVTWEVRSELARTSLVIDNRVVEIAGTGSATIGHAGSRVALRLGSGQAQAPGEFALLPNYPNPFNPTTRISYVLAGPSVVTLEVSDIAGRTVATVIKGELKGAGKHETEFNADGLPSGVYFYRIIAEPRSAGQGGKFQAVRKMLLVR